MKNSKLEKQKIIKQRIKTTIQEIEVRFQQLKLDLSSLSDSDESTEPDPSPAIQVGDLVESRQAPFYTGKVVRFSTNNYWVFIDTGLSYPKKKALHNVRKVKNSRPT